MENIAVTEIKLPDKVSLTAIKPSFLFGVSIFKDPFKLAGAATGSHPLDKGWAMEAPFPAHLSCGKFIFANQSIDSMFTYSQKGSCPFHV